MISPSLFSVSLQKEYSNFLIVLKTTSTLSLPLPPSLSLPNTHTHGYEHENTNLVDRLQIFSDGLRVGAVHGNGFLKGFPLFGLIHTLLKT